METKEAIRTRRSIKEYDTEHVMTDAEKNELWDLAMTSPTAFNLQHWRFVNVEDKELRKQIRAVSWNQAQVTDASMLIIICADLKVWEKNPEKYWLNAPQEVQDILVPAIGGFYKDNEQLQRDEAFRSCGIAAQTIMIAAKGMGYDTCAMDGFDFAEVAKLIKLPENYVITMFVVVGKGTKSAWEKPGQLPVSDVVIQDTF